MANEVKAGASYYQLSTRLWAVVLSEEACPIDIVGHPSSAVSKDKREELKSAWSAAREQYIAQVDPNFFTHADAVKVYDALLADQSPSGIAKRAVAADYIKAIRAAGAAGIDPAGATAAAAAFVDAKAAHEAAMAVSLDAKAAPAMGVVSVDPVGPVELVDTETTALALSHAIGEAHRYGEDVLDPDVRPHWQIRVLGHDPSVTDLEALAKIGYGQTTMADVSDEADWATAEPDEHRLEREARLAQGAAF